MKFFVYFLLLPFIYAAQLLSFDFGFHNLTINNHTIYIENNSNVTIDIQPIDCFNCIPFRVFIHSSNPEDKYIIQTDPSILQDNDINILSKSPYCYAPYNYHTFRNNIYLNGCPNTYEFLIFDPKSNIEQYFPYFITATIIVCILVLIALYYTIYYVKKCIARYKRYHKRPLVLPSYTIDPRTGLHSIVSTDVSSAITTNTNDKIIKRTSSYGRVKVIK